MGNGEGSNGCEQDTMHLHVMLKEQKSYWPMIPRGVASSSWITLHRHIFFLFCFMSLDLKINSFQSYIDHTFFLLKLLQWFWLYVVFFLLLLFISSLYTNPPKSVFKELHILMFILWASKNYLVSIFQTFSSSFWTLQSLLWSHCLIDVFFSRVS